MLDYGIKPYSYLIIQPKVRGGGESESDEDKEEDRPDKLNQMTNMVTLLNDKFEIE